MLPLAGIYGAGVAARGWFYDSGWLPARRLPGKVISVGNLTAGGTGKTPLVLYLAEGWQKRGRRAGILTRGYARELRAPLILEGKRADMPSARLAGDEPLMLARRLPDVPIGVGAGRFANGVRLARDHGAEVFILDDGFQHRQLARDLDLVVVDATDPFGGGLLLPAGRLREPPGALARADIIVLTRAAGAEEALEARLRQLNPRAPIFRAQTRLAGVFDALTGKPAELAAVQRQPAVAFCGLGNPAAFFSDLGRWGFAVADTVTFSDHHRYRRQDIVRILEAARRVSAIALLTTEKDAVNLADPGPARLPVYFCRIELALDDEAGFWAAIEEHLGGTGRIQ